MGIVKSGRVTDFAYRLGLRAMIFSDLNQCQEVSNPGRLKGATTRLLESRFGRLRAYGPPASSTNVPVLPINSSFTRSSTWFLESDLSNENMAPRALMLAV